MSCVTTRRASRHLPSLFLTLTLTALASGASRAAVQVEVAAGPDPARANELLEVELSVANDGPSDRTDVTVLLDIPASLKPLFISTFDGTCPGTTCTAGEQATFTLPTFDVGTAVTFSVPAEVSAAAADGTMIPFNVHVIDDLVEVATGSGSIVVGTPRELELAITQDLDPVAPLETVTYTLSWGLVETSAGLTGATLRFPIPDGTSFVDASNGASPAGGSVEWAFGNLDPGDRGREQVSVSIDAATDLGSALVASATLDDGGSATVTSQVATRVTPDDSLELRLVASPDPARPTETIDLELVVGNDGQFDRTTTEISLEYPELLETMFHSTTDGTCAGTSCDARENQTFPLGTRTPGTGITRSVPIGVQSTVPDGTVIPMVAVVRDNTAATGRAGAAIAVSQARELELELAQARDAITPGDTLDFSVTWGLVDTSIGVTAATLAFRLPPSTTLERVTGGGTSSNGEIVWALGDLDPGDHGQQHVRVLVDGATPEGTALLAEASIDAADAAPLFVRQLSRVELPSPLEIDVITSPDAARPGEVLDLEITVTNTSTFERTGVEMLFEVPDHLNLLFVSTFDGSCAGTTCDRRERATFQIGTLDPGEGRMFAVPIRVDGDVPSGTTIDVEAEVRAGDEVIESAAAFAVDATRRLELALLESDEPVSAPGELTYMLVYGTTFDGGGVDGALLELTLPDEVLLLAASDNGILADGVITWSLGDLDPGSGGSRTAIVQVNGGLVDGELLRARARLVDTASGEEVRFHETTRIDGVRPFDVSFDIEQTHVPPGEMFDVVLAVRNDSGFERTDVTVKVEIPDELETFFHSVTTGTCPGTSCDATENLVYALPSLLSGETMSFPLQFTVNDLSVPGTVINFDAYATDNTDFFSHDGDALMAGSVFDAAGPKPAAGAGAVPDGTNGTPLEVVLLSEDTMLLTWGESCLPDDTDYAIYTGTIGNFTSYSPLDCSTGGAEGAVLLTPLADTFYLVVPVNGSREGSYGRRGDGSQRPPGIGACLLQQIDDTCDEP